MKNKEIIKIANLIADLNDDALRLQQRLRVHDAEEKGLREQLHDAQKANDELGELIDRLVVEKDTLKQLTEALKDSKKHDRDRVLDDYDRITLEIWELIQTLLNIYPQKRTKEARDVIKDIIPILHAIRKSNETELIEATIG